MANPLKIARAIESKARKEFGMSKGTTAGKAKSAKKREIAKSKMSPQMAASKAKLAKATSNKKVARAGVSGNTAAKGMVKGFIKDTKKQGKAYDKNLSNTRKGFPYYASDIPKVPVKKRGK
jgi:hypothetical protein